MTQHSIQLYSPNGEFLRGLRWKSIDVTLAECTVGYLTITLFPEYRDDLFPRDARIAYLRAPDGTTIGTGGRLVGDTLWLLAHRKRAVNEAGQHSIILDCQHPNALLGRRVVAYNEGTSQAKKSDLASDVLYDYINENFVAATDTARNLSSAHFVLDSRPSPGLGPTLDIEGSYRSILDIIQEAAQSAAAQGVYLGYEVYSPLSGSGQANPFRVRFYAHQRGTNRGNSSGQPLIINPFSAHMTEAEVSEDWSSIATYAYAGGSGNQDERQVQTAEDTTLSAQSPFGRVERFDSFNTIDTAVLSSNAYKMLRDYRPRRDFAGVVTPIREQYSGAIYDVNYTWGDIVAARFQAPLINNFGQVYAWEQYQFDVRVNPVHYQVVRLFDDNQNTIDIDEHIEITLQSVDSS